jgi:glycosyltransferase involved in cell wall biosynthesis
LGNLCFVEKAHTDNLIPVRLFHGIRRQRDLLNASRGTSGFIVGSTSMRDELVLNGLSARHINIIPPVPKSLDSVEVIPIGDQPTILYVGQLVRGKGVDLLLRAFQKIHTRASLKIIGEGNHRVECEALALSLGIEQRVEFCGWVDHAELDNYYLQAQVVAVPSRWPEPFGMVGIESMARGRPVIAFDNGGISDWLTDGETGFLVTPGDIDQFAIRLETILVNDALRSAMGKVSSHRVQQQFTHQHFISQMNQLLQETYNEHHDIRVRSR